MERLSEDLFPDTRNQGTTPLRQAQRVMLRLLQYTDKVCSMLEIQYWLDAGTLLGAKRHGGFIPWDDDLDIMMSYEDYCIFIEKAGELFPESIFFQTSKTDPLHEISWAKLRDRKSYMDDPGGPYPYHQGIPIDIFPCYKQTKRQFKWRNFVSLLAPFNNPPLKTSKRFSIKHNIYNSVFGFIQRFFLFLCLLPGFKKGFVSFVSKGAYGLTYNPERPWFQFFTLDMVYPLSKIQFEGFEFFAPHNVEAYLEHYYGDWQALPPESKRVSHNVTQIYPDRPCPFEVSLNT